MLLQSADGFYISQAKAYINHLFYLTGFHILKVSISGLKIIGFFNCIKYRKKSVFFQNVVEHNTRKMKQCG